VVLLAATAGLSAHIALSRPLAGVGWRSGCGRRPWWRAGCCRVDLPVVPLSLGVGLGLLAYGAYLRGQAPERRQATAAVPRTPLAARRTVVVIFVLVMLFWSVAVYAQARGVREAARVAATISRRYRYSGLKLVVRSGGKWFLLPASWTPGTRGAALLLPDTDALRVEFTPGR
jgi:hypothetical protein